MSWYRNGTCSVTNGSPVVTGASTLWASQAKAGDIFIGPDLATYEITTVGGDTEIQIKRLDGLASYAGSTLSGQDYAIIRNFTNTANADLAARLAALLTKWHGGIDEFVNWQAGTVGGGPNSDGTYPMTDPVSGVVSYVSCPAQLGEDIGGVVDIIGQAQDLLDGADASASAAAASAATATTKATTATTKAGEAAASASTASSQASTATTKASEASASAGTATTKASEASASASAAAGSASDASDSAAAAAASETAVGMGLHLPSEAEFEALAAKRRDEDGGSGFVEWGKQWDAIYDGHSSVIGEGFWSYPVVANQLRLGRITDTSKAGVSKTDVPIVHVNGYRLKIKWVNSSNEAIVNAIVFPPAPATSDLLDRQDLMFKEVFHEAISEKDIVYPLGNIHYGDTSYTCPDGTVLTCANGSFTGYDTYSLFGNWQSAGDLIGKGIVWSTMTEAQKKSFCADPENNMYLAPDGSVIQVRHRIRVVEGLGSDWDNVDPQSSNAISADGTSSTYLIPKGQSTSITSDLGASVAEQGGRYIGRYTSTDYAYVDSLGDGHYGLRSSSDTLAYNSKCAALPIALVHRRNQGAFHPVFNPNGTGKVRNNDGVSTNSLLWYQADAYDLTSLEDCFDIGPQPSKTWGYSTIANATSGRPDGLFYDAIYEHDVKDLRNSVHKVYFKRLREKYRNKAIAGEVRGWEKCSRVYSETGTATTTGGALFKIDGWQTTEMAVPYGEVTPAELIIYYVHNNTTGVGKICKPADPYSRLKACDASTFVTAGDSITIFNTSIDRLGLYNRGTSSKTLLHCDIIGDPANYPGNYKFLSSAGVQIVETGEIVKVVSGYVGTGGLVDHFYKRVGGQINSNLGTISSWADTDYWTDMGTSDWLPNGIMGTPLLVGENGEDYIPDGTSKTIKLSRKIEGTEAVLCLHSDSNGATWATNNYFKSLDGNWSSTTNATTMSAPIGRLMLVFYTTEASPMEVADNAEVLDLGDVWAGQEASPERGSLLISSLLGKIPIAADNSGRGTSVNIDHYRILEGELGSGYGNPTHPNLIQWANFVTGVVCPTVKTLSYLTSENGQAYLQLVFKEMVYDTDWGDDNTFDLVDGISTTIDDNGNTVLIGQMRIKLPYFIGDAE